MAAETICPSCASNKLFGFQLVFVATSALTYNNDFQMASATTAGSQTTFTYDADGLRTAAGDLNLTSDPQNGLLTGLSLASTTTQISEPPRV